ncbi:MAG: T9SS type A sorting domain-containing protein [Ignavibacteriales bacterium]|nr:T9SS type A sorting domain-containing protein [Ignavibacteriales bacterium]
MKRLGTMFLFVILVSTGALSQNYQVTNIQGIQLLDPPVLDIQNNTARIIHNTNFWFYSFPASGPSAPIATSSAVHPRPIDSGPINVAMKSSGNNIVICYIISKSSPTPGWFVESVSSPDGGMTWTIPTQIEQIAPYEALSIPYDNIVLEKSAGMGGTALLYYRVPSDSNRFHMANNHGFGAMYSFSMIFPAGDATHEAKNLSCFAIPNGPMNDIIYSAYSVDTSLYLITHNTQAGPPGSPSKILSIAGGGSYFTRTRLVGNSNGTLYLAFGFWQLIMGQEMMHSMKEGTVLYKSTNSGSTWAFADTLSQSLNTINDLQITSTGTLVHTKVENANIYIRSSLNGSQWSSFYQVNPTTGTAAKKDAFYFGISTALVDDANIGVAWIDTSTGYDEIFYRKFAIPAPATVGVLENERSTPDQFALNQNFPNPFNPTTVISYQLPEASHVAIKVFDMLGREVATLVDGVKSAGQHTVELNASKLRSGIYFYRLSVVPSARRDLVPTEGRNGQAGSFMETKKLVLLK